jgi:hypoxanthine phosphoribosyltransferase
VFSVSKQFPVLLSTEQISKRIKELGEQITKDYQGKEIAIVGILNGSFVFCADLVREIKVPVNVEFMGASSYGSGTTTSGEVKITLDVKSSLEGKHVLIVEDIVDTGHTLKSILEILQVRKPASLKLASFLYKPSRNIHPVDINYLAFEIEDHFVIGYGLDYDGRYRELPYVGIYQE